MSNLESTTTGGRWWNTEATGGRWWNTEAINVRLTDVHINKDHPIFAAPIPADGDDMTWNDTPLAYPALVALVYRLQNEVAGLAAQVVELREQMQAWEGDS